MSDIASSGRSVSITVKYGTTFEDTWTRFSGLPSEVREDICAYFGIDPQRVADQSLNDLVINVTQLAHGVSAAAVALGAVVLGAKDAAATEGKGSVWDQVTPDQVDAPATPTSPLFAEIDAASTVQELTKVWATNQDAFADEELMAAYKARGKALQAAAK